MVPVEPQITYKHIVILYQITVVQELDKIWTSQLPTISIIGTVMELMEEQVYDVLLLEEETEYVTIP
jgi:hypothetical protein